MTPLASIFNVSCRKVGGLRFIKFGRLTVSYSISKPSVPAAPSIKARPYVKALGDGLYVAAVDLMVSGKVHATRESLPLYCASTAMMFARDAVRAANLKIAR